MVIIILMIMNQKQYYLIDNKLYKVKKDKTQGDLVGSYINDTIIPN